MNSKAIGGFINFELKLFLRNFITVFFLLVFPTMMLLIFGSIYGNAPSELFGGVGVINMFVPAYSGIVIAVTGLMNIPISLCEYREKGIFKRYKATPTRPGYLIVALLIINTCMTIIGMAILIIVGKIVFNIEITGNFPQCFLVFMISVFAIFAIGFFVGAIAPNMKASNSIAYLLYFPMLFLSGATMPYEIFPKGLQNVAKILPMTYSVKAMKSVWNGGNLADNASSLIILLAIGLVFWIASIKAFKWDT